MKKHNFRFKRKEDRFIWKNNKMRIEFSDSSMQPWDGILYPHSVKDVLYYYYNVKVYLKKEKKWKKKVEINTYDAPAVVGLQAILEKMLNGEIPQEDYMQVAVPESSVALFSYRMNTEGFVNEDFFEVIHNIRTQDGKAVAEWYDLVAGGSEYNMSDYSVCVRYGSLSKEEIQELKKCVDAFIEASLAKEREKEKTHLEKAVGSCKTQEGKLYQYKEDGKSLEAVFCVDDKINVSILVGDIGDKYPKEISYESVLTDISEGEIELTGGIKRERMDYCSMEGIQTRLPVDKIIYINHELDNDDPRLMYDEEEVYKDFRSILTGKELSELKKEDEKILFEKWKDAIIDRTWMCRDEHPFQETTGGENAIETAEAVVMEIIKKIKKEETEK